MPKNDDRTLIEVMGPNASVIPQNAPQHPRSAPQPTTDWGTIESDPGKFLMAYFLFHHSFPILGLFTLLLEKIGVKGITCQEILTFDDGELESLGFSFLLFFSS